MKQIPNVRLSVIMSVYNEKEIWVKESIDSILNQTYNNFEFIIIVDSPQNSALVLQTEMYAQADSRIKVIINEKNIGLADSLNKALEISSGEFIARIDADDICEIDRFSKQINYLLENPQVGLVGTNITFIDENSNSINRRQKVLTSFSLIEKLIPYRNLFHHPTWMFRKEVLRVIKGYRSFPCSQDYDFICRCISNGIICSNINERLVKYRIRSNSISVEKKYQQSLIVQYVQKLYRKQKKNIEDNFSSSEVISLIQKAEATQEKYVISEKYYELSIQSLRSSKVFKALTFFILSFYKLPNYRYNRLKNAYMIRFINKWYKINEGGDIK